MSQIDHIVASRRHKSITNVQNIRGADHNLVIIGSTCKLSVGKKHIKTENNNVQL